MASLNERGVGQGDGRGRPGHHERGGAVGVEREPAPERVERPDAVAGERADQARSLWHNGGSAARQGWVTNEEGPLKRAL